MLKYIKTTKTYKNRSLLGLFAVSSWTDKTTSVQNETAE